MQFLVAGQRTESGSESHKLDAGNIVWITERRCNLSTNIHSMAFEISNYGMTLESEQVDLLPPEAHPPQAQLPTQGKPNANAISIATIAADSAKTAIFGYEPGVAMPGLTAPARRLALFLGDDSAEVLNTGGVNLLDAAIKWTRGGGSLSGSKVSSPASVDLTATGVLDWAHWGRSGPTTFDHKTGVTQPITDVTKIGTGGLSWFSDCPTAFSWTNGTPTLSVSNTTTGINTNGVVGNGFEITVPADMNTKTLKVYVGVWFTQGRLEASLSDASAPMYVDTSLNNNAGSSFGVYTISFKAASAGQTLKIRYTIQTQYFSPNGNVAFEGATLQSAS